LFLRVEVTTVKAGIDKIPAELSQAGDNVLGSEIQNFIKFGIRKIYHTTERNHLVHLLTSFWSMLTMLIY
jgi:hypothetical protein